MIYLYIKLTVLVLQLEGRVVGGGTGSCGVLVGPSEIDPDTRMQTGIVIAGNVEIRDSLVIALQTFGVCFNIKITLPVVGIPIVMIRLPYLYTV